MKRFAKNWLYTCYTVIVIGALIYVIAILTSLLGDWIFWGAFFLGVTFIATALFEALDVFENKGNE